jgi:putative addiction module killer protein
MVAVWADSVNQKLNSYNAKGGRCEDGADARHGGAHGEGGGGLMNHRQNVFEFDASDVYRWWLDGLADRAGAERVRRQVDRARAGNFGKVESVGGGVYEIKVDFGPGYRVYFFQLAPGRYWLLCGGDKSTQAEDVKYAKAL